MSSTPITSADRIGPRNSNNGGASEGRTMESAWFRSVGQNGPVTMIDFAAVPRNSHGAPGIDTENEIVVAIFSDKPPGADHRTRRV